jgi:hypothetical protein
LLNLDDGSSHIKENDGSGPNIKIEAFDNGNLVADDSKIKYNSELKVNVISGMDQTNQAFL